MSEKKNIVVAYMRVSTEKQQLENQRREISIYAERHGIIIDEWQEEIVSGTKDEDVRVLGDIMKRLEEGDALIVSEVSRLSRKLVDLMIIMSKCLKKQIEIYCIKENLIFKDGNDISNKILIFAFSIASEIERSLISTRTKEALARKKAEGIILGRPRGSSIKLQKLIINREMIALLLERKISKSAIAITLGVSRPTLYKYLRLTHEK